VIKNNLVVIWDFDSTILDTDALIARYLKERFPKEEILEARPSWDFSSFFADGKASHSSDILSNLIWKIDSKKVFNVEHSAILPFVRPVLSYFRSLRITSILGSSNPNPSFVNEVLYHHRLECFFEAKIFCFGRGSKDFLVGDILIDDYPLGCSDKEGRKVFVVETSYNRNVDFGCAVTRLDCLIDILRILGEEQNESRHNKEG
jgi:hypothetical protein